MSSAVDANVLVYAADTSSPRHTAAARLLGGLARGPDLLYVFWPVATAFLRIATHPGLFATPLDPITARHNLDDLLRRPHVRTPGEDIGFWNVFCATVGDQVVRGNLVPDAHLVALMRQYGVTTLWTSDRDFRRFPAITPIDPADWPGQSSGVGARH